MSVFARVHMPALGGATEWLNSEPLGPAELQGRVVVVNFWTWTCISWLRQEPYVRAWSQAYGDDGLIVIGPHAGVLLRARLERVREPLLAGAVRRRRRRHHPRPALRRRTLREIRTRS